MRRGQLLGIVHLLFGDTGALHVESPVSGNALVSIESGSPTSIVADRYILGTIGTDDDRLVPDWFAHRVVAILRADMGEPAPLRETVLAYMQARKEGNDA